MKGGMFMAEFNDELIGVVTFQQAFQEYPDSWLIVKPIKREGYMIAKMIVLRQYTSKEEVFKEARKRKRASEDVAIVCTFDEGKAEEVEPRESAFMLQMCCGFDVPESYLIE